jgi:hypothetical protein
MKKLNLFGAALLIAASSMIYSCKKEQKAEPLGSDDQTEISEQAGDESEVQSNSDEIADDVNIAMDENSSVGGRYASGLCDDNRDVTVDSAAKKITIVYKGIYCAISAKTKSGTVVATLIAGNKWRDAGAKILIEVNLNVSKAGKSIKIEGTKTITNFTGGLLKELTSGSFITHVVRASFSITLPNGIEKRSWKVARRITFRKDGFVKFIEISGDTTVDGVSGVVIWGKNRRGEDFKNAILSTLKANSACGWHRPTAGVRTHIGNKTFKAIFGLDDSGVPVIAPNCASKFKVEWTNQAGENKSILLNY